MDRRIGRQGGWGLVVMLIALAIVAWLYRGALKAYLPLPSPPSESTRAGTPVSKELAVEEVGAATINSSSPAPSQAIDRARSVEGTVMRGAEQRANQIDRAAR
jgi:hypothetical protein